VQGNAIPASTVENEVLEAATCACARWTTPTVPAPEDPPGDGEEDPTSEAQSVEEPAEASDAALAAGADYRGLGRGAATPYFLAKAVHLSLTSSRFALYS